eukprot:scaffold614974_cov22-Prasinocladus_malaysianus.AAC.1
METKKDANRLKWTPVVSSPRDFHPWQEDKEYLARSNHGCDGGRKCMYSVLSAKKSMRGLQAV